MQIDTFAVGDETEYLCLCLRAPSTTGALICMLDVCKLLESPGNDRKNGPLHEQNQFANQCTGDVVFMSSYALGRSPALWEDATTFNPVSAQLPAPHLSKLTPVNAIKTMIPCTTT